MAAVVQYTVGPHREPMAAAAGVAQLSTRETIHRVVHDVRLWKTGRSIVQVNHRNESVAHVLGIQSPRLVHVVRSLDDRSPVWKNRELVSINVKLEHETVIRNWPKRCELTFELFERQSLGRTVRDLHGVAAA